MEPATVVIDNGTGYTKMGYAGNLEPSYLIPSVIATAVNKVRIVGSSNHPYRTSRQQCRTRASRTQTWTSTSATRR